MNHHYLIFRSDQDDFQVLPESEHQIFWKTPLKDSQEIFTTGNLHLCLLSDPSKNSISWQNLLFHQKDEEQLFLLALHYLWPLHKSPLISLPTLWTKNLENEKQELTYYGGSFNPWHQGHQVCLDLCPEKKIIIIPDKNPWKEQGPTSTSWETFKFLVRHFVTSSYALYPGFLGINHSNPTYFWLKEVLPLKKNFLMGDDNFLKIEKWHHALELLALLQVLYVVPRTANLQELEDHRQKLLKLAPGIKINILPNHPYQDLSSSKIRQS